MAQKERSYQNSSVHATSTENKRIFIPVMRDFKTTRLWALNRIKQHISDLNLASVCQSTEKPCLTLNLKKAYSILAEGILLKKNDVHMTNMTLIEYISNNISIDDVGCFSFGCFVLWSPNGMLFLSKFVLPCFSLMCLLDWSIWMKIPLWRTQIFPICLCACDSFSRRQPLSSCLRWVFWTRCEVPIRVSGPFTGIISSIYSWIDLIFGFPPSLRRLHCWTNTQYEQAPNGGVDSM